MNCGDIFAYVSDDTSSAVRVFNVNTGQTVTTVPVSGSPGASALDPYHHKLFVACQDNAINVIDTQGNQTKVRIPLNFVPGSIELNAADDLLYVNSADGSRTAMIDPVTNRLISVQDVTSAFPGVNFAVTGMPKDFAIDSATNTIYAACNNGIHVVQNGTMIGTFDVRNSHQLALDASRNVLYAQDASTNAVYAVNTQTGAVTALTGVNQRIVDTSVDTRRGLAYFLNADNSVSVVDTATNKLLENLPNPSGIPFTASGLSVSSCGDSFIGKPGAPGPQGITGPEGQRGPRGYQGTTGPEGQRGPRGYQGTTGPEGERGPRGYQGTTGPEGQRGPRGYQGTTGPQGLRGYDGATGATGPRGYQGITGPEGQRGPRGYQGTTGPTGPRGYQGTTGPEGQRGPRGYQGTTGPTGPRGYQGTTGPEGQRGPRGYQGTTGPQGLRGYDGATGPQGPRGATGATGATGTFTSDSISLVSKCGRVVASGHPIPMARLISQNGSNASQSHTQGNYTLAAGTYLVNYRLTACASRPGRVSAGLLLNGQVYPTPSTSYYAGAPVEISGSTVVTANGKSTLSLVNLSNRAVKCSAVSLTIVQIA
jgi:hypothetical protein